MLDISDLLGCRFVNHGRSKSEGFDCYGLAIEVSKRLGHELPDIWYETSSSKTFTSKADEVFEVMEGKIEETDEQTLGNLIVFFDGNGCMVHIGVFLKPRLFIHADGTSVRVENLDYYYRKQWKVYKWL